MALLTSKNSGRKVLLTQLTEILIRYKALVVILVSEKIILAILPKPPIVNKLSIHVFKIDNP